MAGHRAVPLCQEGHTEAQAALQRTMRQAFIGSVQKRDAALLRVCRRHGKGVASYPQESDLSRHRQGAPRPVPEAAGHLQVLW